MCWIHWKVVQECMTKYLQHNKINKIKIKHIKLHTQFNPIGLYILLHITKKGRWPNFVVQKVPACLLNDNQIDTDDEELREHTLNLKVLGVTNKDR